MRYKAYSVVGPSVCMLRVGRGGGGGGRTGHYPLLSHINDPWDTNNAQCPGCDLGCRATIDVLSPKTCYVILPSPG